MNDVAALFLELVQIDSHSLEEGKMAKRLRTELEKLGFQVYEDGAGVALGGQTGNLVATLAGDPVRTKVLLAAHMDTVRPGEKVKPHIDEDGVVHSDGQTILGADDKAGVTAILTGLKKLVASGEAHGQVQVLFSIAEEIGLQGAKHLDAKLLDAEMGLSLDSGGTLGTLVVKGPAQAKWSALVKGRAAHAGVAPERGISAIRVAAKAVARMPHGRIDSETTVNVGSFVGEGPTNVVRDQVSLLGEARSIAPEKLERALADVERAFEEAATEYGATVSFEAKTMYAGFHFTPDDEVFQAAAAALRACGHEPNAVSSGGGSDANVITALGVPTINIGIGYEEIHSTSEHIRLSDIEQAADVVYAFCRQ